MIWAGVLNRFDDCLEAATRQLPNNNVLPVSDWLSPPEKVFRSLFTLINRMHAWILFTQYIYFFVKKKLQPTPTIAPDSSSSVAEFAPSDQITQPEQSTSNLIDRGFLLDILRITNLILANTSRRSLYNSLDALCALLQADDAEIIVSGKLIVTSFDIELEDASYCCSIFFVVVVVVSHEIATDRLFFNSARYWQ
jgi:hypothetical protein